MTTFRQRLRAGEPLIGSWINSGSPIMAELMAGCGFDWLTIDAEHSAVDLPQAQQLLQAIRSGQPECAGFVRIPGVDYAQAKRYMDAGATGLICPLVNTAEQARQVVESVKYPGRVDHGEGVAPERPEKGDREAQASGLIPQPSGRRGVGFCRDNLYGLDLVDRVGRANAETVVCVQIEHVDGVENIDEILAVEGVDAAFIGPYDLSASMGITAQFDHADFLAAKARILDACRKHCVAAGIHVVQPDIAAAQSAMDEGYSLIAYSLDITMVTATSLKSLEHLKEKRCES